jgi:cytoskeletal protein CcmA (bactofilin family)
LRHHENERSVVSPDKFEGPSAGASQLSVSTVGGDLTITGNVTSKGEIRLEGHVQGDVHCVSLILGENSSIEGGVTAEDVLVRGRLKGSVRALRVTLLSTAHVEGDLIHQSLALEQGAYFEGKAQRSNDPLPTATTPTPDTQPVAHNAAVFVRSLPEPE